MEEPLSQEELERYRRGLSMLHESHVQKEYRELWKQVKMENDELPSVQRFQQFVSAFKQLWKWQRR